jgi:hypothetical protein
MGHRILVRRNFGNRSNFRIILTQDQLYLLIFFLLLEIFILFLFVKIFVKVLETLKIYYRIEAVLS